MEIGMLWKDDDPRRTLEEKLAIAMEFYEGKYGERPTICVVHPHTLPEGIEFVGSMRLLTAKTVQINHFWLGVEGHAPQPRTRMKAEAR
jgi:hypothetical protein